MTHHSGNDEQAKDAGGIHRLVIYAVSFAFAAALVLCVAVESQAKDRFVQGSLGNHYKLRTTGDVTDYDLEALLTLSFGDPSYQRLTGALQGGGIFDLNGSGGNSLYSDVYNTFSNESAVGRLYSAYMDVRRIKGIELLRTGRHHLYEFESAYFDGVSLDTGPFYGVKMTVFGGVPVHQFENQIGVEWGDWTVGGALQWTPIVRARLRVDYTHLKDDTAAFRLTQQDTEDDLFSGSLWAELAKNLTVSSRVTAFSDQMRDGEAELGWRLPKQDFSLRLRAFRLLEGYDIRVLNWDAYSIAGTYVPYTEVGLTATKGLGKYLTVDAGGNWRKLDDKQVSSAFNHGYVRGFLSASTQGFPVKGLSVSATADYYRSDDSSFQNDNFGGSAFVAQDLFKKRLKLSGGTAYYLYRYNLMTGTESDDVQIYFAKVEGKVTKTVRVKSGYEFEDNDLNGFHTMNLSVIWDF